MFRLASTKVTTPVNESAQVLLAERSRSSRISATVVKAELPALHGQTMADRMRIIVRKRSIIIIVVPIYPFLQGKPHACVAMGNIDSSGTIGIRRLWPGSARHLGGVEGRAHTVSGIMESVMPRFHEKEPLSALLLGFCG
jgi:hypothetical protein